MHLKTHFKFANPDKVNKKKRVATDMALLARPVPVVGLQKLQVGIYNATNKAGKEKGLSAWLQKKLGRPPVLFNESTVEQSRLVLEKYLQDNGYFGSIVNLDTTVKSKKVTVDYTVTSKGQYFVHEIFRPADTLQLIRVLAEQETKSLLKTDRPYQLLQLNLERARLADIANENGFFDVTKDNFYYFIDTTAGELQTDIYLRLKQLGDSSLYQIYYLDQAIVYPDYSLQRDTAIHLSDTLHLGKMCIMQRSEVLRPSVLGRLIWQDSVAVFSKKEQRNTINRLINLGIYKFADMRFEKKMRQDTHYLDRVIYLTPGLMRDLGAEFQVNSRTGNFLGTEVSGSYSHKNLFRGAELFTINLTTGLETNIGAKTDNIINTLNLGLNASLGLPGIHAPFVDRKKIKGETLPRTSFSIGDDYQRRTGFFTVNSFNLSVGYNWQKARWQQQFNPLFVNLVNVLQTSGKLDTLLTQNRRLRASFENVFIVGLSHKLSVSNQGMDQKRRYFFWRGGFESAGSVLNLAASVTGQDKPRQVLGVIFAQYLKFDSDFRQYFPLRKGMLAGRFNLGIGYPYGNAVVLPYIKQYFIGGASSVRAFRIRTLGPGSFQSKLEDNGSNFVDQTGDLRLEANLEYRFPIFSFLKGALFADAGNIWLLRGDADESTPEADGRFKFDTFLDEMAVGTGFGLRLDFEVAVVRLDWAFPVRKPVQTDGGKWLISDVDFLSKRWRRDNLVWNIAIGYPF